MSLKDWERAVLAEPGAEPRAQSVEDELRELQHRARVKELAAEIVEKDAELLARLAEGVPAFVRGNDVIDRLAADPLTDEAAARGTGWCAPSP